MGAEDSQYRQTMNQISAVMDLMRPMIGHISRLTDTVGRSDAEFQKIGRNFHDLRQDMIGLRSDIDSVKSNVDGVKSNGDSLKSDIASLKSDIASLRNEFIAFKSSITERLDAIFLRLDEIENSGLRNELALRNLASEMVLQHNTILNAIQDSHNNKLALEEFDKRLTDLENQVRQLRRN